MVVGRAETGSGNTPAAGDPRVFVLDRQGKALMPCHPARARELLRKGRAVAGHHPGRR
ncbi:RRXRR domain-containing protein [Streptomyces sp. T028]|uniref:RRXRR domain-containing protein n=1 Tax=Streptomyces sp. T028 TaxID=3394379 RepID=UPI003A8482A3